jgi:hypothetical protein
VGYSTDELGMSEGHDGTPVLEPYLSFSVPSMHRVCM